MLLSLSFSAFPLLACAYPRSTPSSLIDTNNDTLILPIERLNVPHNVSGSIQKRLKTPLNYADGAFIVHIQIDDGPVQPVVLDSGEGNSWVAKEDFTCVDLDDHSQELEQSDCGLGSPLWNDAINEIATLNLAADYGSDAREMVQGTFGEQSVTVFGTATETITANKVAFGFADRLAWKGDGITVGLLGLAMSSDIDQLSEVFPPAWMKICERMGKPHAFTLGLQRPGSDKGGVLVFGSVPTSQPALQYDSQSMVTVPLVNRHSPFWTVKVLGFASQSALDRSVAQEATSFTAIVNSGEAGLRLPKTIAETFARHFNPPGKPRSDGLYDVSCEAQPPPGLKINIGGTFFNIDIDAVFVEIGSGCRILVAGVEDGEPIALGTPFLTEVLAVHDADNEQLQFAARQY